MKSETTLLEIYKWLSEGKKIRQVAYGDKEFIHVQNNTLVEENGIEVVMCSFSHPDGWELYQEPVEKVKWFRVTSFAKCQNRPYATNGLCESKEDYLKATGSKEDDYHWIVLEEVKYE